MAAEHVIACRERRLIRVNKRVQRGRIADEQRLVRLIEASERVASHLDQAIQTEMMIGMKMRDEHRFDLD